MPNKPLKFGQYYHIYNRGNNRENIFIEPRNYPYFLKLYTKHILPIADTFAYCLMQNHFHMLIRTYTEKEQEGYWCSQQIESAPEISSPFKIIEPSRAFNNMFIAYTRAVNKATKRTGALFQRPFGRKMVTNNAYFQTLIVYIHHNPQKHGFVDDFRDWKWSSHNAIGSSKPTNIERTTILGWFDGLPSFREAHKQPVNEQYITSFIDDTF